MKITEDLFKQIRPQNKDYAGKYSWHFYKFLYNNRYEDIEIYKTIIEGTNFYSVRINNELWMTDISHIILDCYFKRHTYCGHLADLYTDEFFKNYIQYGKCFVIPHNRDTLDDFDVREHGIGRWKYIDNSTRICNWCNKKQVARNKTITIKEWQDE